jgi:hypothetical protein
MEKSKTVLSITVRSIVSELTKLCELRADVGIVACSDSSLLHVVPVTISISTSNCIVGHNIIRTSKPPSTWGLISVQETVRRSGQDRQVAIIDAFSLNGIFDEE